MRAKKSDYPEMFLGGFMKKRKEGKGFFGNSQAKFADMEGAEGGIDMRFKGGGPFAGKGSALRREKRALKRAQRRGQLGEDGADRLDYLRSVQKDRAKKAVGAGALAAGAAFGGAALAGKLGAKGAGGLFKGGMKGVFKGGAKEGGKQGLFNFGAQEGGKKGFMDKFARNLAKRRLQNMGEATDSVEENYGTIDYPSAGNGAMVKKYRSGGMIYAEDSDLLQEEKDKKKTSSNSEPPGMERVRRALGLTGSNLFFGAFPQEEIEEEPSKAKEREFTSGMKAVKEGTNMLPEVEIVGEKEQPKERGFYQIEGDPNETIAIQGADGKIRRMTRAERNQEIIDEWNAANPDDQKEDIIEKEETRPFSDEYLYMRWLRAQGRPESMKIYQSQPEVMKAIERGRIQVEEEQGGYFSDGTKLRASPSSGLTFIKGLPPEAHYKPKFMYGSE